MKKWPLSHLEYLERPVLYKECPHPDLSPVFTAAVSPDGEHVVFGNEEAPVCVWNVDARTVKKIPIAAGAGSKCIQFAMSGPMDHSKFLVYTPSGNGYSNVFELDDNTVSGGNPNDATFFCFSHDGMLIGKDPHPPPSPPNQKIGAGLEHGIAVLDSRTMTPRWIRCELSDIRYQFCCGAFSNDDTMFAAGGDQVACVWNVNSGDIISEVCNDPVFDIWAVAWSSDDTMLACFNGAQQDYGVSVYDIATNTCLGKVYRMPPYSTTESVTFIENQLLVYNETNSVGLWDPRRPGTNAFIFGRDSCVSPDASRVVFLKNDGFVTMSCTSTGEALWTSRCHQKSVFCGRISANGTLLVTCGKDGIVRLFLLAKYRWSPNTHYIFPKSVKECVFLLHLAQRCGRSIFSHLPIEVLWMILAFAYEIPSLPRSGDSVASGTKRKSHPSPDRD